MAPWFEDVSCWMGSIWEEPNCRHWSPGKGQATFLSFFGTSTHSYGTSSMESSSNCTVLQCFQPYTHKCTHGIHLLWARFPRNPTWVLWKCKEGWQEGKGQEVRRFFIWGLWWWFVFQYLCSFQCVVCSWILLFWMCEAAVELCCSR